MQCFPVPLLLASTSPRRAELMNMLHYPYTVAAPTDDESSHIASPAALVEQLALRKAQSVARAQGGPAWVIGADTIVCIDGQVLGKPASAAQARQMLQALQGRSHEVYTGIALVEARGGRQLSGCERTLVHVGALSSAQIEEYVQSGEPLDKAGAYGIQGRFACYISGIEGDFYNVMGLPLYALRKLLASAAHAWR